MLRATKRQNKDYKQDFFGAQQTWPCLASWKVKRITMAAAGDIYTFRPTFRAENSNTTRHLAGFGWLEPEMAFYGLEDNNATGARFLAIPR